MRSNSPTVRLIGTATVVFVSLVASESHADVAVIANRTRVKIAVKAIDASSELLQFEIDAGSCIAVPIAGERDIEFRSNDIKREGKLALNNAYVLEEDADDSIVLRRLLTDEVKTKLPLRPTPKGTSVVHLKVLVDDEEPGSQRGWEARLRHRVALASALLERDCRLTLKVAEVSSWKSDDNLIKLDDMLADFERKVKGSDDTLTIGFCSQHIADAEQPHLGVTRSPLHTHILIGEGTRGLSEAERLEVLVHELGHYLGARHCTDRSSIMRGQLGDRQARSKRFRLGMDPLNLLAMNLVADEIRHGHQQSPAKLSEPTQARLKQIYALLEPVAELKTAPDKTSIATRPEVDPTPGLSSDTKLTANVGKSGTPLVEATRKVIQAVRIAAQANARVRKPVTSDALAELYVRAAANCASELPDEVGPQAFVRGVAIACDHDSFLRRQAITKSFCLEVEGETEHQIRLRFIGKPSLHNRGDLWQHFTVSMYLTGVVGPFPAEAAGLAKEHADARGGSGFSFADLLADHAGIALAKQALRQSGALQAISESFTVKSFIPPIDDLPEGLSQDDLRARYGEPSDPRFRQAIQQVLTRVEKHVKAPQ